MTAAKRIGVVLFDSANNVAAGDRTFISLDSGWASASGEPALRIRSIQDLPSDVLWVTNLTDDQFSRARLHSHPNFRAEGFLRSTLRHIYAELGADPMQVPPDTAAAVLATVAQRTLNVSASRHGVTAKSLRALNEDFAVSLSAPRSTVEATYYPMIESSAQHAFSRTLRTHTYVQGAQALTLRRNRVLHARELLSQPLPPDTGWTLIGRHQLPVAKADMERVLERLDGAWMVRCSVTNISPLVSDVFSVGGGARVIRDWLTDVEWRVAKRYADIDYDAVIACDSPSVVSPLCAAVPNAALDHLSYTNQLVAEQLWTSLTVRRGARDDQRYTAAAAWLRAQDRMTMFDYAQVLHGRGLNVSGYGVGMVVALYPEGGLRHALDVSTDIGLLVPASRLHEARRQSQMEALAHV